MRKPQETRNIRLMYLFHLFNNLGLTVVANFLFLDQLFLRMQLDLSHIGLIKGTSYILPMAVNLMIAPAVKRWNRDREIVAIGYLLRVSLPLLILLYPGLGLERDMLALLTALTLMVTHLFPIVANNSIHVLVSSTFGVRTLGRHIGLLHLIWTLPGFLLAIPISLYMDTFAMQSDAEFYRGLFLSMLGTGVFQAAASFCIIRIPRKRREESEADRSSGWFGHVSAPFRNRDFFRLLRVLMLGTLFTSMLRDFINPYFLTVLNMNMGTISLFSAGVSVLSIVSFPVWGVVADRIGGRNGYRIAMVGLVLGIAALQGRGLVFLVIFALFAWDGSRGFFGSGIQTIHQYMIMINTPQEERNTYFAAATFSTGVGLFIGSSLGGLLLEWLIGILPPEGGREAAFRLYFVAAMVGLIWVGLLVSRLPHDRQHIPGKDMWLYLYRRTRAVFGRFR